MSCNDGNGMRWLANFSTLIHILTTIGQLPTIKSFPLISDDSSSFGTRNISSKSSVYCFNIVFITILVKWWHKNNAFHLFDELRYLWLLSYWWCTTIPTTNLMFEGHFDQRETMHCCDKGIDCIPLGSSFIHIYICKNTSNQPNHLRIWIIRFGCSRNGFLHNGFWYSSNCI